MLKRNDYTDRLKNYILYKSKTASMVFVRGRRRIGKSTLLKSIDQEIKDVSYFYFSGVADEKKEATLKRWVKSWLKLYPDSIISKYSSHYLTWYEIYDEIVNQLRKSKKKMVIVIDEIQWAAKARSGMIGALKEKWLELESHPQLKIIICGSSNKFFSESTGGEEKILRGLCTHNDIWINEIKLKELKEYYGKNFNLEEVVFFDMAMAGIPYYWNQINTHVSFFGEFDRLFFKKESMFLKEVSEILNLEFNSLSNRNVEKILMAIGLLGKTLNEIQVATKISNTTIYDLVEKLVQYRILGSESNYREIKLKNTRGEKYFIQDTFLQFYFSFLVKYKRKILNTNDQAFIFNDLSASKKGIYIENVSGVMFERYVKKILRQDDLRNQKIFNDLSILNCEYEVGFILNAEAQIDIYLSQVTDRRNRLIECKWTHDKEQIKKAIVDFKNKRKKLKLESDLMCLITNCPLTQGLCDLAASEDVLLLDLESML